MLPIAKLSIAFSSMAHEKVRVNFQMKKDTRISPSLTFANRIMV